MISCFPCWLRRVGLFLGPPCGLLYNHVLIGQQARFIYYLEPRPVPHSCQLTPRVFTMFGDHLFPELQDIWSQAPLGTELCTLSSGGTGLLVTHGSGLEPGQKNENSHWGHLTSLDGRDGPDSSLPTYRGTLHSRTLSDSPGLQQDLGPCLLYDYCLHLSDAHLPLAGPVVEGPGISRLPKSLVL